MTHQGETLHVSSDFRSTRHAGGFIHTTHLARHRLTVSTLILPAKHKAAGGAEGDRTPDLLIANEALSHLSYSPAFARR